MQLLVTPKWLCPLLLAVLLLGTPLESHSELHWTQVAAHVGRNESSRDSALKALSKMKNLDGLLIAALDTPNRALALDVISARQSAHLLPQLLERIPRDEDGFLTLCINSLMTSENQNAILSHYGNLLQTEQRKPLSPGALVALLEPLGRLGSELPESVLSTLLQHEYPEVRSATLYYIRRMSLFNQNSNSFHLVSKALQGSPYQLRLQAWFLLAEVAKKNKMRPPSNLEFLRGICNKEKKDLVKQSCEKLLSRYRGGES